MNNRILIILVLVLIILNIYQYFKSPIDNSLVLNDTDVEMGFIVSNNLSCEVTSASSREELHRRLSFLDLTSDDPKLLSDKGGTLPFKKFFENEDTLVIGQIASGSGSTDFVVFNKKTGKFARTTSGNLQGVYAFASKGVCK